MPSRRKKHIAEVCDNECTLDRNAGVKKCGCSADCPRFIMLMCAAKSHFHHSRLDQANDVGVKSPAVKMSEKRKKIKCSAKDKGKIDEIT